jgi:hypothetical protein
MRADHLVSERITASWSGMQEAVAAADVLLRDLPGQRHHRRVARIGGGQSRGAVEEARTRHHAVDLRPAGRHGRAQRHVGGALLMPGMHDPDAVAGMEEGVHQHVVLHAGQAEQGVDPVGGERGDHRFRGIEPGHRSLVLLGA